MTARYELDLSKLPSRDKDLRIRLDRRVVNGKNPLLLLHPDDPGAEPSYARYAAGARLQSGDGPVVQGSGQVVFTGERVLGMFTSGTAGQQVLDEKRGAVYVFSIDRDDIDQVVPKTNWRGKPIQVTVASSEDLAPWFVLEIFSVMALVMNNGQVTITSLPSLLERLTPEGRKSLQSS